MIRLQQQCRKQEALDNYIKFRALLSHYSFIVKLNIFASYEGKFLFVNMEGNVTKLLESFSNLPESRQTSETDYKREKVPLYTFWGYVVAYMLIALISAIANGFLLFVTYGERNFGRLRYLDHAIKSLAITDMLFGLIGAPFRVVVDYLVYGKLLYSIRKKLLYRLCR